MWAGPGGPGGWSLESSPLRAGFGGGGLFFSAACVVLSHHSQISLHCKSLALAPGTELSSGEGVQSTYPQTQQTAARSGCLRDPGPSRPCPALPSPAPPVTLRSTFCPAAHLDVSFIIAQDWGLAGLCDTGKLLWLSAHPLPQP